MEIVWASSTAVPVAQQEPRFSSGASCFGSNLVEFGKFVVGFFAPPIQITTMPLVAITDNFNDRRRRLGRKGRETFASPRVMMKGGPQR